ncbi:MAG: hypothetical protein FWF59_05455 [Turicibacter sp.]|nr:hypothetical protein [Turicibacter sp.]
MRVDAQLKTQGTFCSLITLIYPEPVMLPKCRDFTVEWGGVDAGVRAISRLSGQLFELHLLTGQPFPIFEAGKYESFPGDCFSKIHIAYHGVPKKEGSGEPIGSEIIFDIGWPQGGC